MPFDFRRLEIPDLILITPQVFKDARGFFLEIYWPVSMETFNLLARRPQFSAMTGNRLAGLLKADIPTWEEGVELFLREGTVVHEQ